MELVMQHGTKAVLILLLLLGGIVTRRDDRYSGSRQAVVRSIIAAGGLLLLIGGWLMLAQTIDDPEPSLMFIAFFFGPLLMLTGTMSIVVGLFFPTDTARGYLRWMFRVGLHDKVD